MIEKFDRASAVASGSEMFDAPDSRRAYPVAALGLVGHHRKPPLWRAGFARHVVESFVLATQLPTPYIISDGHRCELGASAKLG